MVMTVDAHAFMEGPLGSSVHLMPGCAETRFAGQARFWRGRVMLDTPQMAGKQPFGCQIHGWPALIPRDDARGVFANCVHRKVKPFVCLVAAWCMECLMSFECDPAAVWHK